MSYGSPVPDCYEEVPFEEQEKRIEMNEDMCIIDDEYFFIRGSLCNFRGRYLNNFIGNNVFYIMELQKKDYFSLT